MIVPTRGQANDLKSRLIAKGCSHLGLQFVTPAILGALLARDDATPRIAPEHLRLLLATSASEMEDRPDESQALAAKAVARSPAPLLRANVAFQAVQVPAGRHQLHFFYQDRAFQLGATISGLAWIASLSVLLILRRKR